VHLAAPPQAERVERQMLKEQLEAARAAAAAAAGGSDRSEAVRQAWRARDLQHRLDAHTARVRGLLDWQSQLDALQLVAGTATGREPQADVQELAEGLWTHTLSLGLPPAQVFAALLASAAALRVRVEELQMRCEEGEGEAALAWGLAVLAEEEAAAKDAAEAAALQQLGRVEVGWAGHQARGGLAAQLVGCMLCAWADMHQTQRLIHPPLSACPQPQDLERQVHASEAQCAEALTHLAEARAARADAELRLGDAAREAARLHAQLAEAGAAAPPNPGAMPWRGARRACGLRPGGGVRVGGGAAAAAQQRQQRRRGQLALWARPAATAEPALAPGRRRGLLLSGLLPDDGTRRRVRGQAPGGMDASTLLQPGGAMLGALGWLAAATSGGERRAPPRVGEGWQLRRRGAHPPAGGWLQWPAAGA
jgi:hypothetical protein